MGLLKKLSIFLLFAIYSWQACIAEDDDAEAQTEKSSPASVANETEQESTTGDAQPAKETTDSQKQTTQEKELAPLKLTQRVRANANIDLPKDI